MTDLSIKVFHQPDSISQMSRRRRWFVFMSGLFETALWSGVIFGWASLVHILKMRGVYSHLCEESKPLNSTYSPISPLDSNNSSIVSDSDPLTGRSFEIDLRCPAQDERFALVGTVAMVLYSSPGVLLGYALHYFGQAFTRTIASLTISLGFFLLSLTSKENPDFVWGGAILLSIGGNTIRIACLEFGNLFPKRRNTVMALICGIYTLSASLFMAMQAAEEAGYQWEKICQFLAAAASLILVTTPFIPRHHIPYDDKTEDEIQLKPSNPKEGPGIAVSTKEKEAQATHQVRDPPNAVPVTDSIFSVSMLLFQFWLFCNLFAITIYGVYFNSWVNRFAKSNEEAADYSRMFGFASLFCIFITPLPGLAIDYISNHLKKGKTGIGEKVAGVQAMILPMIIVNITSMLQISCFFFFSRWAVYSGYVMLVLNRPSVMGVGIPFVRARFPPEHFNRLIGIQGTFIALLTTIQYPHFTWTQIHYYPAIGVVVALQFLSLAQPIHLFSKGYLERVLSTSRSTKEIESGRYLDK